MSSSVKEFEHFFFVMLSIFEGVGRVGIERAWSLLMDVHFMPQISSQETNTLSNGCKNAIE